MDKQNNTNTTVKDFDSIDNESPEDDAISESNESNNIEDNFKVDDIDFEPFRSSDEKNCFEFELSGRSLYQYLSTIYDLVEN